MEDVRKFFEEPMATPEEMKVFLLFIVQRTRDLSRKPSRSSWNFLAGQPPMLRTNLFQQNREEKKDLRW
jgi:hypothetical protein